MEKPNQCTRNHNRENVKKYIAKPLEDHLQDLHGTPEQKTAKLIDITYIYSTPATPSNVKKYLRTEGEPDWEVYHEKDESGNTVPHGVVFYWQTPIFARVNTIGQFISVATALDRELYWEEETYRKYVYINSKY